MATAEAGMTARLVGSNEFPAPPMYGTRALDPMTVRIAFLGRVSDEDLQDPTLSIPRQVKNVRTAVGRDGAITAYFWDVESGRKAVEARGASRAHEKFDVPVPRDGGVADLLAEAHLPADQRRFDAVACEGIDRVARRTYFGVRIEYELEQCGVPLLAADEGVAVLRKRATQILTRRVKQATSEWYVLETLEKAWDGFCEHAAQGWNIGVPPYGYVADTVPHPIPAKRAEGLSKTRLLPDATRAPVVATIFAWRVDERLSYQAIADRLNADLALYPPPRANVAARTRGSWSAASVRGVLTNPKYTGHMVWNRRARNTGRSRHNDRTLWVVSPEPTHPAIVSVETFDRAQRTTRQGSRVTWPNKNAAADATYLLRSYVQCSHCGRRMEGATRKRKKTTYTYYTCSPARNLGPDAHERFPGHGKTYYVREDALTAGVLDFFATRIFSADRSEHLAESLSDADTEAHKEWLQRTDNLAAALAEVTSRRERLVARLETEEDVDLLDDIRSRHSTLVAQQRQLAADLASLRANPPVQSVDDPALLDLLGTISRDDLAALPADRLRDLFDAFALAISYDPDTRTATCDVTIAEGTPSHDLPHAEELGMFVARSEGLEPPTF